MTDTAIEALRSVITDAWDSAIPLAGSPEECYQLLSERLRVAGYKIMPREPTEQAKRIVAFYFTEDDEAPPTDTELGLAANAIRAMWDGSP